VKFVVTTIKIIKKNVSSLCCHAYRLLILLLLNNSTGLQSLRLQNMLLLISLLLHYNLSICYDNYTELGKLFHASYFSARATVKMFSSLP